MSEKNVNYFMWTDQVKKIKLTQCIEHDGRTIIGFQEMLMPVLSFYVQNKASNYVNCLLFRPGDQKKKALVLVTTFS